MLHYLSPTAPPIAIDIIEDSSYSTTSLIRSSGLDVVFYQGHQLKMASSLATSRLIKPFLLFEVHGFVGD